MRKAVGTAGDSVGDVSSGVKERSASAKTASSLNGWSLDLQTNPLPFLKGSAHSDNVNVLHRES